MKLYRVLQVDHGEIYVRYGSTWIDRDRAEQEARAIGGFVVVWEPEIVADYRSE